MSAINLSERGTRLFGALASLTLLDSLQISYRSNIGFGGQFGEPSLYSALIVSGALLLMVSGNAFREVLGKSPLLRGEACCLGLWYCLLAFLSLPGLPITASYFLYCVAAITAIYSVVLIWRSPVKNEAPESKSTSHPGTV